MNIKICQAVRNDGQSQFLLGYNRYVMRLIKFLRLEKGWSQSDLAKISRIAQPQISLLECYGNKHKNVSGSTLRRIAEVLEHKDNPYKLLDHVEIIRTE